MGDTVEHVNKRTVVASKTSFFYENVWIYFYYEDYILAELVQIRTYTLIPNISAHRLYSKSGYWSVKAVLKIQLFLSFYYADIIN